MSPRRVSPGSREKYAQRGSHTQHRVIELGGSKEKARRRSRERSQSNYSNEGFRPQDMSFHSEAVRTQEMGGIHDTWKRKVAMLENRIRELHSEKQALAVNLNNKIADLEHENIRLVNMLRDYEKSYRTQRSRSRSNQSQRSVPVRTMNRRDFGTSCTQNDGFGRSSFANTDEFGREGEFNIQEMLSNQIEVNLELREQIDRYSEEMEQYRMREERNECDLVKYRDENADLKLQVFQMQDNSSGDEVRNLREKISYLE